MQEERTRLSYPAELRISSAGNRTTISGLAIPWRLLSIDLGGFRERFLPGAFGASVYNDIWLDVEHDRKLIVARTKNRSLRLYPNEDGLRIEIDPLASTTKGGDVIENIRTGLIDGLSVAFTGAISTFSGGGPGRVRTISQAVLQSIALTSSPAYRQTQGTLKIESGGGRTLDADLAWRRQIIEAAEAADLRDMQRRNEADLAYLRSLRQREK